MDVIVIYYKILYSFLKAVDIDKSGDEDTARAIRVLADS